MLCTELSQKISRAKTTQEMQDFRLLEELKEAESCDELLDLKQEVIDLQTVFSLRVNDLLENCVSHIAQIRSLNESNYDENYNNISIEKGHRLISG